jgi:oxygen-independent coproporphyrinogen-3 oxidase
MRCGFCNLFTTTHPGEELETAYLAALQRQAGRVRAALGSARVVRLAIGGGTPTYLDPRRLAALFDLCEKEFGVGARQIPVSVETSPLTATAERLRLLRERGVDRISIGVQSFIAAEAAAAGRAQQTASVEAALERIRATGFPTLNIDLIYGLPGQSVASWRESLRAALRFAPEELYLYPLYRRPLTGLDRRQVAWEDVRLDCYRAGQELLLAAGYEQVSMRMFRQPSMEVAAPVYCCQEDGMVGLGCGARSYTRRLHYATEYAVGARGVREILADYVARPAEAFDVADYGCFLNEEEQRRRYVIQSLLQAEGLSLAGYAAWFGAEAWQDLPELAELEPCGLAVAEGGWLRLTEAGLEQSDVIGPWLYSQAVRGLAEGFVLR